MKHTPMSPTPTKSTIWARAISELPTTLPTSSCRTGTALTRISTIRDCFSSTTLGAIVIPNSSDAM